VVAGVERLGRVGNLVGGVAAEALDAGVRPSTASASMDAVVEFGGVGVAELVDVDLDTGLLAVAGPAVVGGVAGKVPSTGGASVDAWG
jgi:hypothetical protein